MTNITKCQFVFVSVHVFTKLFLFVAYVEYNPRIYTRTDSRVDDGDEN